MQDRAKVTGTRYGGRRAAWLAAATAAVAGGGLLAGAGPAFAADPSCGGLSEGGGVATVTCAYTGSAQSWTVPAGVTEATITLDGGQGGNSGVGFTDWPQSVGGKGATVTATLAVTPGDAYTVQAGGAAPGNGIEAGGYNGGGGGDFEGGVPLLSGGGGGASSFALGADLLAVAGGGGGGGGQSFSDNQVVGGNGGASAAPGSAGTEGNGNAQASGGGGGGAGTATAGGAGGAGQNGGASGGPGSSSTGGSSGSGGGGLGGDGGGGGGGYYGGAGGGGGGEGFDPDTDDDYGTGGGGGGGSDFTEPSATTVAVSDGAWSGNGQVTISYAVSQLSVTTTSLPIAIQGTAYSRQVSATGGIAPYTWSVDTGSLPPGVTLSPSGLLSGTPTASGSSAFTAQVTDATNTTSATGLLNLTVNPAPPTVTGISPQSGTTSGGTTVTVTGAGFAGATAVEFGSTPATGFTVVSDTQLTVVAPSGNTGTVGITVTTSYGESTVTPADQYTYIAAPTVITTTLPAATQGSAYSQQLTASGGTTPYTWSLAGGSLPAGLTLSPGGVIAGTPKASGTSAFTVKVTDAGNPAMTATAQLSVAVVADKADVAGAVTGPASAKPGALVTDTITVTDKGPVAASKVKVTLDGAGLAGVTANLGGSTKSSTFLGVTLSTTTWTVVSLAPGQTLTFTITGTVPARGIKAAIAAGLALSATPDPDLLNNAGLVTTRITS